MNYRALVSIMTKLILYNMIHFRNLIPAKNITFQPSMIKRMLELLTDTLN